jgi:hypothetical protein
MNEECRRAQDEIPGFLDGESPGEGRAGLSAHLTACSSCKAELEAYRASWGLFRAVHPKAPLPEALGKNPYEKRATWYWLAPALVGFAAAGVGALLVLRAPKPPAPAPTLMGSLGGLTPPLRSRRSSGLPMPPIPRIAVLPSPAPLPARQGGGLAPAPEAGHRGPGLDPAPYWQQKESLLLEDRIYFAVIELKAPRRLS